MPDRDAFGNPTDAPPPAAAPTTPLASGGGMDPESLAWMSLGFSAAGWLLMPVLLPIVGIVLAHRVRPRLAPSTARSATTAALWIAWTNIVLCVLAFVLVVFVVASWDGYDF